MKAMRDGLLFYFVPDVMRHYCKFDLSSRGMGFVAMVSGAGGL